MARVPLAIALVAGLVTLARAQPVTRPAEAPASVAPKAAAKPKAAKSKAAKAKAAKAKAAKAKAKQAKLAKASRATKSAKARKRKGRVSARVAARRGNNMPNGFEWPPSAAMRYAAGRCEDALTTLGVAWRASPASEGRIVAPIEIPGMVLGGITYTSVYRKPPHRMDCQLARTLVELGPSLASLGVREVRFGSIYRWTNVRTGGTEKPFLSRHALGLAMDIVEMIDGDGRTANVERDYLSDDPLLLAVEQLVNDSGKFRIVLTPRNDPQSHDDHFHIEANPDYAP